MQSVCGVAVEWVSAAASSEHDQPLEGLHTAATVVLCVWSVYGCVCVSSNVTPSPPAPPRLTSTSLPLLPPRPARAHIPSSPSPPPLLHSCDHHLHALPNLCVRVGQQTWSLYRYITSLAAYVSRTTAGPAQHLSCCCWRTLLLHLLPHPPCTCHFVDSCCVANSQHSPVCVTCVSVCWVVCGRESSVVCSEVRCESTGGLSSSPPVVCGYPHPLCVVTDSNSHSVHSVWRGVLASRGPGRGCHARVCKLLVVCELVSMCVPIDSALILYVPISLRLVVGASCCVDSSVRKGWLQVPACFFVTGASSVCT